MRDEMNIRSLDSQDTKLLEDFLAPAPEYRNQGFARTLVNFTLNELKKQGAAKALLFTDNPAAIKAYEAIGFMMIRHYRLALLKRAVLCLISYCQQYYRSKHLELISHRNQNITFSIIYIAKTMILLDFVQPAV